MKELGTLFFIYTCLLCVYPLYTYTQTTMHIILTHTHTRRCPHNFSKTISQLDICGLFPSLLFLIMLKSLFLIISLGQTFNRNLGSNNTNVLRFFFGHTHKSFPENGKKSMHLLFLLVIYEAPLSLHPHQLRNSFTDLGMHQNHLEVFPVRFLGPAPKSLT